MEALNYYITQFAKLRRAPQYGGAPHKPILLLSILDAVEQGYITNQRIYLSEQLLALFRSNWDIWVKTPHIMSIAFPFYHLHNESFWTLVTKSNKSIPLTKSNSIKSLEALKQSVDYADRKSVV